MENSNAGISIKNKKKKKRKAKKKNVKKEIEFQVDCIKEISHRFWENAQCSFEVGYFVNVCIEYVLSSREFYVYRVCEKSNFEEFQQAFDQSYTQSSEQILQPSINNICAVKIGSIWYRANIIENFATKECKVMLVDYGRTKRVEQSDLRMLKYEFLNISPMVTHCELCILDHLLLNEREKAGTTPEGDKSEFERNVIDRFNAILTHIPTTRIMIKSIANRRCKVFLYFGGIEKDLIRNAFALSECYAAFFIDGLSCPQGIAWLSCPRGPDQLSDDERSDKKIPVLLSHVESPAEIYVFLERDVQYYRSLQLRIQKYISIELRDGRERQVLEWRPRQNCLVFTRDPGDMYSLNTWHRGCVIAMTNVRKARVRLRDIGAEIETDAVFLLRMPKLFNKFPNYAHRCHLGSLRSWSASVSERLILASKNFLSLAIVIDAKRNNSLSVTFWGCKQTMDSDLTTITDWIDINNLLITDSIVQITNYFVEKHREQRQVLKNLIRSSMSELVAYDKENAHDPAIPPDFQFSLLNHVEPRPSDIYVQVNEVQEWLPSHPIEKSMFIAIPTHVTNNFVIYLQDSERDHLAMMIRDIIHYRLTMYDDTVTVPTNCYAGQACFARYSFDGYFYRAQIIRLNRQRSNCLVKFVDYGNTEYCNLEDLRVANMFGNIPMLARKYCLERIRPMRPNQKWPSDVLDYCHRLIVYDHCYVRLAEPKYERDITPCSLDAVGVHDLKTFLIQSGWAENVRKPPASARPWLA